MHKIQKNPTLFYSTVVEFSEAVTRIASDSYS